MTPCRPAKAHLVLEAVEALCSALTRLDRPAVENCCSDLESQISLLRGGGLRLTSAESDKLRGDLELARKLMENASRLYAGWARAAALDPAYTCSGELPVLEASRRFIGQG